VAKPGANHRRYYERKARKPGAKHALIN